MTSEFAGIAAASERLLAVLATVDADRFAEPSRLPDWTVGNVVAHIALNAEAFVRVADDRRNDRVGVMYPHGVEGRNADIAALGDTTVAAIIERLRLAVDTFGAAWSSPVPEGPTCTAVGFPEFDSSEVPLRRLREVEVHGLDTGLSGLSFDTWSEHFVMTDLPTQWANIGRRTGGPINVVDEDGNIWALGIANTEPFPVQRRELLAWVLDRHAIDSLPTLIPWGEQSRWSTIPPS